MKNDADGAADEVAHTLTEPESQHTKGTTNPNDPMAKNRIKARAVVAERERQAVQPPAGNANQCAEEQSKKCASDAVNDGHGV